MFAYFELFLVISVAVQQGAAQGAVETTTFSLKESNQESRSCTTQSGAAGVCVKYTQCRDNYTIDTYGTIDDNDIRVGSCPGRFHWCCLLEGVAPAPAHLDNPATAAAECPSCVIRHRAAVQQGAAQGAAGAVETTTFSLKESNPESRSCTTQSGAAGVCVKYTQCRDNYTIDTYGTIDDNDIRVGSCPGRYYWCCSQDDAAPAPAHQECPAAAAAECPWCVTLHRSGGRPSLRAADGRYCGGVLAAGGGALLTAGSCVRAATKQELWVVSRADNYTVHSAAVHPNYGSGSREHDLAVIVLSKVAGAGACLPAPTAPTAPPAGARCVVVGYEKEGAMVLTEVSVTIGLCGAVGGKEGALCARPLSAAANCRVSLGSPLLCADGGSGGGGWAVWGVSRGGGCGPAGATYSSVAAEREWLDQLLPRAPDNTISTTEQYFNL